jgi:bifunctional UDP-N-acetylglucosamine pyrophosphorylase/glucosamine-1-phosphate N-acetyltransferase
MAAGLGTRMKSALPKHLHPILGRRMVDWVLAAAHEIELGPLVVVASPSTADLFTGLDVVVQERPLGTGDAVRSARELLESRADEVLVLSGDTPLLTSALLRQLIDTHRQDEAAATVLSFCPEDVRSYGRVLRDENGRVSAIVEAGDASPAELAVREVNSSIYVFAAAKLWPGLERLEPANAQGELYLTDAIRVLVADGELVSAHVASDPIETEGVNTRLEMANAAAILRDRINEAHMLAGATIVDPVSTWIEPTVELEPDSIVHPFCILRGRTRVRSGAEVGPQVVAVDAEIGEGVTVGPFCYLRPGTVLEKGAKAGTFVEIKNSHVGAGAKVPHLSYIGDSEIGEGTNVAAGAITANYRPELGRGKQTTKIGRNVRTGVHNSFVPPVEIGDDSVIAAGSVITDDVPPGALAIARARQLNKEGYARGPDGD